MLTPKGEDPSGSRFEKSCFDKSSLSKLNPKGCQPRRVKTLQGLDYLEEKEKGLKKKKRKFDSCLGQRQLKKIRHALRIAKQF